MIGDTLTMTALLYRIYHLCSFHWYGIGQMKYKTVKNQIYVVLLERYGSNTVREIRRRRGGVMEGSVKDLSMYRLAVEKYLTENSRD